MLIALGLLLMRDRLPGGGDTTGPLYTVREGPLTISVVTAGTVQSRRTATVRSQAEGRNTVIWIIDEGRSHQRQLLVELDSSACRPQDGSVILVGNAESATPPPRVAIARTSASSVRRGCCNLPARAGSTRRAISAVSGGEQDRTGTREVERRRNSLDAGWRRGYLTRASCRRRDGRQAKQINLAPPSPP